MSQDAQTAGAQSSNPNPNIVIDPDTVNNILSQVMGALNQQQQQAAPAAPAAAPVQPKVEQGTDFSSALSAFVNVGNDESATKIIESNEATFAQVGKRLREASQVGLPAVTRWGHAVEENAWLAYPAAGGKLLLGAGAGYGLWQLGKVFLSWFRA